LLLIVQKPHCNSPKVIAFSVVLFVARYSPSPTVRWTSRLSL
jgi:hypothetical protein